MAGGGAVADEGSFIGRVLWAAMIGFAVVGAILAVVHGLTLDGAEAREYWVRLAIEVIFSGAILAGLLTVTTIISKVERRRSSSGRRRADGTKGDADWSGSDEFGCGSDGGGDGGGD